MYYIYHFVRLSIHEFVCALLFMNVVILVFFKENKEALEMFMSHVEDWKSDTKVMRKSVPDILSY